MAPKKGQKRVAVERKPLDLQKISTYKVQPGMDMQTRRPAQRERDSEQIFFDDLVRQAWEIWNNLGRPTDWKDNEGTEIVLPTQLVKKTRTVTNKETGEKKTETYEVDELVDTAMWRVRRAGAHFDMKIRFGEISREDGYSSVVFTAVTRADGEKPDEQTYDDDNDGNGEDTIYQAGPDQPELLENFPPDPSSLS
jgi:hypothetical protein